MFIRRFGSDLFAELSWPVRSGHWCSGWRAFNGTACWSQEVAVR